MVNHRLQKEIRQLYKDYSNGAITLEEREDKIQKLKDFAIFEEHIDPTSIDPSFSPTEKLEACKKMTYKLCQESAITEDERETIIRIYQQYLFSN